MNSLTQDREPARAAPSSRWARAISAPGEDGRTALSELAASYWYCAYAWWRRAGFEAGEAASATRACFSRCLGEAPPQEIDSGSARLREWLPSRLAEFAGSEVELTSEPLIDLDPDWAESRYADEPEGEPDAIFQRRWALTVLEFAASTLQGEYAARGEEALFTELLPFAGFEPADDKRYAAAGERAGCSSGAMHKAVFEFRTRQREVLRAIIADTVVDPADTDGEITTLLCAIDIPGATDANTPLPSAIQSLRPDEIFARAMQSVRMTAASRGGWTPPSDAEIARLFPEYEVLGLLGRGGMGAVYKARQIELDRVVAVKLLPLEVSADRDFADRFRREARAMAKMSHPHIITVYDFGTTSEGHLFFVMEYVEGANLDDMIRKVGIEPAQALVLAAQVCTALAYAHEKGIVHRDIKPANVMVDLAGQAKVADFGLARVNDGAADAPGHTVTGTVMGTPDYMAPEQKHGMHVDHRADIYSVGVMLYEMLCRETPQGAFEPPSKRIGCDTRIDKIVLKAMQQAPDRRYQTTHEMRADVATALTPPTRTPKPRVPTVPLQPQVEPPRSGSPVFTVAFVAVLGVLGYVIYQKMKPPQIVATPPPITTPAPTAAPTTPKPEEPKPASSENAKSSAPKTTEALIATAPTTPAPTTPTPAPAVPLSATGKWIAEQEPLWKAAYAAEVSGPFEKGVAALKGQYLAAIDTQLVALAKAAKLDDAVAFRTELERMARGGDVPAEDEAAVPAPIKTLRASYRTAFTKLDTERFTRAKTVHARYDTILAQSQALLTQKQRLDEALEMKATREKLSAAWLTPPGGTAVQAPAVAAAAPPKPVAAEQGPRALLAPAILKDGFTNILGMKFVPVKGTDVLFCVHETRRQDYAAYASQVSGVDGRWQNEQSKGVPVGGENIHPVVAVSWEDAQAFCAWLSKMDGKTYRLPTDEEWSFAVGIGNKERRTKDTMPEMLHYKDRDDFPWDGTVPLKTKDRPGNYADSAYHEKFPADRWNEGYSDGFPTTAPVMSFKPSKVGLYDMGGNVREWVDDWWNTSQQERVVRGSDWGNSPPPGDRSLYLASSYRGHYAAGGRSPTVGFRAVVENRLPAKSAAGIAKTTAPPPGTNKPTGATEADGWEDLLAPVTPERLKQNGDGWRREGAALRSPDRPFARVPLGTFAASSYQLRLKLRQLIPKDGFTIMLPVGDRLVGFTIDGLRSEGYFTGLNRVDGKRGKDLPGSVLGQVVKDSDLHELEVTVRLDGAEANISATFDARPLSAWAGPIASLSPNWPDQMKFADTLALVSFADDWLVTETKVKRLDAATAAKPAPPVNTFGPWQPLFTDAEWNAPKTSNREVVDGRLHLLGPALLKPHPAVDGVIRARIQFQQGSNGMGFYARAAADGGRYKIYVLKGRSIDLVHVEPGTAAATIANTHRLATYILPKPFQPGDTFLLELRLQGDRLTALVDGAAVIEAQDSRSPGPGQWGIIAMDGWFESVEVQTPLPAAPPTAP
ncbi:MAG: bifunctional serine/threonine-protein kinase/formylglycine-generating enzyme family protein [Chthoniobacteraceae bacterium]